MKKLMMKAKAGVTLVELLVVILIVTILSVSLLPLLKPYIEEAKYAAEPIPVLANIQTKINLYQYEKDNLPGSFKTAGDNDKYGQTWTTNKNTTTAGVITYVPAYRAYQTPTDQAAGTAHADPVEWSASAGDHLQDQIDVDWQDLLGRRMNPTHFTYHVIKGDGASQYGYAVGVFGDGNGLGKGTGYAVLTLVDTVNSNKVVATWSRYKPVSDVQVEFSTEAHGTVGKNTHCCWVPKTAVAFPTGGGSGWDNIITGLKATGWEFMGND